MVAGSASSVSARNIATVKLHEDFLLDLEFAPPSLPPVQAASPQPAPAADTGAEAIASLLPEPDSDAEAARHLPPPEPHLTGTQLRKRLITAESLAPEALPARPSLLQRVRWKLARTKRVNQAGRR